MTRRDDDIPAELRDVAAQLRALGPEEWEPAAPPPLRAPCPSARAVAAAAGPPLAPAPGRSRPPGAGARGLGAAGGALIRARRDARRGATWRSRAVGNGPPGAHADARLGAAPPCG